MKRIPRSAPGDFPKVSSISFKETIMKKHLALAGIVLLAAACSHEGSSPSSKGDLGTGLNTIERKYNRPAAETYDAARSAVQAFNLSIDRDRHDEMGGELTARRADNHQVTLSVIAIDKDNSRATVRVEPGNSALATMIHEKISNKLGMATAKAAFFGGNSADYPYDADLQTGVAAAERAVKALGWTVIGKEVKDDWAQIDARAEDSNPARIKMERVNDVAFPLKVTFIGGHGKTDVSKSMIGLMHDEFDRQVGGHVK